MNNKHYFSGMLILINLMSLSDLIILKNKSDYRQLRGADIGVLAIILL